MSILNPLPGERPEAFIFDLDDTLAATGVLWREAETHLLREIGHVWSAELALQYKGMNALDVAATIHRLVGPKQSLEWCQEVMRSALFRAFEKGPISAMPGAVECVQALAAARPMAVASGSPLPLIELALERLGVRGAFRVVVSSESVARGKPSPDIFLAAAQALKADPARCLVFEDSLVGVRAALAAGMACFAVPSSNAELIARLATRTFGSLGEVSLEDAELALKPRA